MQFVATIEFRSVIDHALIKVEEIELIASDQCEAHTKLTAQLMLLNGGLSKPHEELWYAAREPLRTAEACD